MSEFRSERTTPNALASARLDTAAWRSHPDRSRFALWAVVAALGAGLLAFSQSGHWRWDEGFYLAAAQLINAGKRPYVDFFHQQVPLYAYVTAGWMRVFGESWRSAHLLSALLTGGSILLVAGFVWSRFSGLAGWGLAAATTAALLMGLDLAVIQLGTMAQPYALCLFLSVAAFRLAVGAVDRPGRGLAFWAGLAAGGATGASLLMAPVGPVLLGWLCWRAGRGARRRLGVPFLVGMAIPFAPLAWLALRAPRAALFNVVEFQLFHRAAMWDVGAKHRYHLRMLSEWLHSPQTLLLGVLAGVAVLFLMGRSEWEARRRAEFYLCIWLAGALGVYLASTYPTASIYFVLLVPYLSILAVVGVYALGSRMWGAGRPGWLVVAVVGLFALGLAKMAYREREALGPCWPVIEALAREVKRVTPAGLVYANEHIHFAAGRLPPAGLENYRARLPVPPEFAASVRAVPHRAVEEWLAAGRFATVVIDEADHPDVGRLALGRLYGNHKELHNCYIPEGHMFWGRLGPSHGSP